MYQFFALIVNCFGIGGLFGGLVLLVGLKIGKNIGKRKGKMIDEQEWLLYSSCYNIEEKESLNEVIQ